MNINMTFGFSHTCWTGPKLRVAPVQRSGFSFFVFAYTRFSMKRKLHRIQKSGPYSA